MSSSDRTTALIVIWAAFAIAALFTFAGDSTNVYDIFLGLIYALAALGATYFVTQPGLQSVESKREREAHKLKNEDAALLDRLIASMDDQQLNALRRRLSDDDGEVVSLDALMRQRDQRP